MAALKSDPPRKGDDVSSRYLSIAVGVLSLVCLGLWGLALYRSNYIPGLSPNAQITPTQIAAPERSCQDLINQALHISGNYCDHISPNKVCYGNTNIQADLLPNTQQRFAKAGDVVDIQTVQHISTSPLNLQKNEWGIAVFNIIANLPRSLPGEAVKMVVFGNTTLGNNGVQDIQSFYFFSELGQIACDQLPFDGIMITMPDGTGINLKINGSDLLLMGDASLSAVKNGNMSINLFSGTASITSDGQTQYFGAGQKVQVPLGGTNGIDAIGPPSIATVIQTTEVLTACAMAGISCLTNTIPTIAANVAQATLDANNPTMPAVQATPGIQATISSPTKPPKDDGDVGPAPAPTGHVRNTPHPETTRRSPPGQEKKTHTPENHSPKH